MKTPALRRIIEAGTEVHMLFAEPCRRVADAHRDLFGPAFVDHCLVGSDFDSSGRTALEAWEALRRRIGARTRYNSPRRFLNGLRQAAPGQPKPLAVMLIRYGEAIAVVAGFHERSSVAKNVRLFELALPRVRTLTVPQTALITDGNATSASCIAAYLKATLREGLFERIDLANIRADDPLVAALTEPSGLSDRMMAFDKVRWTRRLTDPQTGERLNHESSKTRSRLRGKRKTLTKQLGGDLKLSVVTEPSATDDFVQKAASIVRQTYQASLGIGVEDNDVYRAFAKEMATDGVFRGYLLLGRGDPISYVVGDLQDGVFSLWATSFLPQWQKFSPGIILLTIVMDDLIEAGAHLFDFGEGEAKYKELLGSDLRAEHDFRAYGMSLHCRAAYALDWGAVKLRTRGLGLLRSTGMLDHARKNWRRVLLRLGTDHPSSGRRHPAHSDRNAAYVDR